MPYCRARILAHQFALGLALGLLIYLGHPGYALGLLALLAGLMALFIAISDSEAA